MRRVSGTLGPMDWHRDVLVSYSTDGRRVAEVDMTSGPIDVDRLVAYAKDRAADLVWVHGGDLADAGFNRVAGYAQLRGMAHSATTPAEIIDLAGSPDLLTQAYLGLWGHKRVEAAAAADEECLVIGLPERDTIVGLCRVWPAMRLVDGPGVVPATRTVDRKVQLLLGAGAALGAGPISVDTWGEDQPTLQAYRDLGYSISTRTAGWELAI
jgi:hypothetical protein